MKKDKKQDEERRDTIEVKDVNMKTIKFILQKSSELEKKHPLISYFCLLYVVEKLNIYVKNNASDKEAKKIFISCLELAEKRRSSFAKLDEGELATFCKRLLIASDESYRTKQIPSKTINLFFTSQIFYEILSHFKPLDEDEKKKHIYAKYKTVYLKKCIDSGKIPEPETSEKEKDTTVIEDTYKYKKKQSEEEITHEKIQENIQEKNNFNSKENINSIMNKETVSSIKEEKKSNNVKDECNNIGESMRHAQYAVNALMFEDTETAIKELRLALSYLGQK